MKKLECYKWNTIGLKGFFLIKFKFFLYIILIIFGLSACEDSKTEQLSIDTKLNEAKSYFQKYEINKAIYLMDRFIEKYPSRFEGYVLLLGFKYSSYDSPKNIDKLSDKEKKEFKELILLSKRAVALFETLDHIEQETYLYQKGYFSFFIFIGHLYYEYGMYEKSIDFFDKYYDKELHISHPKFKFFIIEYADALAQSGYTDEGAALYAKYFSVNGEDAKIISAYAEFISNYPNK